MKGSRRRWLRHLTLWLALGAASAPVDVQAEEPAVAPSPQQLQLRAALGVGAHSRSFERPAGTGTGTLTMPTAYVPAIEAGFGVVIWPAADFSLAITLSYQTGLWLTVSELPPFAHANEVSVRSQRLALQIAPSWRISGSTRLGFALGGTIRSFWPDDHALQTPSYNLVGPHARAELATKLIGPLRLRMALELQWVIAVESHAKAASLSAAQGAAIGGELALELTLGPKRALALCYRESHALLARGASFQDVERYLTLRIEEAF